VSSSPGTVSKILWHFTGGPRWDTTKNIQDKRKKTSKQAWLALRGIIDSKSLRLGSYCTFRDFLACYAARLSSLSAVA
jgi:hypothetical protein